MTNTRATFIVLLIVFLAAILRLPFLDKYPNGFSQDEAIQGYTAYSILKTGKDEWGTFLPLIPRSFGDYKSPLYTYLTIPSVAIFGLNEFAVRLPSALAGIATVLLLFFLVRKLFGDDLIALLSAFFLAISPWHFQFSRSALEANLLPFFIILGFLLFVHGIEKSKFLMISFLIFGLSIYSYQSAKLFVPLFAVCLLVWVRKKLSFRLVSLLILTLTIFFIPILFSPGPRTLDVSIFKKEQLLAVNDQLESCLKFFPVEICRAFYNKATFSSTFFANNYLSYFSPSFLFTQNRPNVSFLNLPGTPLYYLFQLPLVLMGVYFILTKKNLKLPLFSWLLLGPLPAALTIGEMHVQRSVSFLPLFSILAALGVIFLHHKIKPQFQKFLTVLVTGVSLVSLLFITQKYFLETSSSPHETLHFGYKEAISYLETVKGNYDKIIFSKSSSEPQAFIAFYTKLDPKVYQSHAQDFLRYEKEGKTYLDQLATYSLGKYEFHDIDWARDKIIPDILMVGKPEEFPSNVSGLKTVHLPNGEIAFRIVESEVKR